IDNRQELRTEPSIVSLVGPNDRPSDPNCQAFRATPMFHRTSRPGRRGETRTWIVILLTAVVCFALALPLSTFLLVGLGFAGLTFRAEEEARMAEMMARDAAEQAEMARLQADKARQAEEDARKKTGQAQQGLAEQLLRAETALYHSRIALAQSEWQGK